MKFLVILTFPFLFPALVFDSMEQDRLGFVQASKHVWKQCLKFWADIKWFSLDWD